MIVWAPQPGPQTRAVTCPVDVILFGGTRGGGKTDAALGRQILGAEAHGRHWNGLIIRRKFKDFAELRRRIDELISLGLPAVRIGGENQVNYVRFLNGALITMVALMRADMLDDLVGQQYTEVSIEEGTKLPFFSRAVDKLKGSLRSPHGVPCSIFVTGNPGGPGHGDVKGMFITPNPETSKPSYPEPGQVFYDAAGYSYVFIRSELSDNKILCDNDPKFEERLRSITDPALRKAWLEGDWDVYLGQAFSFNRDYHVLRNPPPVPEHAPLISTFDWGFGAPFSWGWWWMDADGRLYRFAEWYGWSGVANEGLRLTDQQIAEGILERERKLGIAGRPIVRLAGPDCFAQKPDYKGKGQGKSTSEELAEHGIILQAGDPDRLTKIKQFRERMRVKRDADGHALGMPMLVVYPNCRDFIRVIPSLSIDEDNLEDIDTEQEDHIYDEACHAVMYRPGPISEAVQHAHATAASAGGVAGWVRK